MASLIYLDTHVVSWMFAGRLDLFPVQVRKLLEEHDLLISPAVKLELQYLFEIRRIADPAKVVLEEPRREVGLKVCDLPFPMWWRSLSRSIGRETPRSPVPPSARPSFAKHR